MPDATIDLASMKSGARDAAALMRALAHEGRLMVMCALCSREYSVGELAEVTGLSQSALSQHLARLRSDGLVATRREAQTVYYRLIDPTVKPIVRILHKSYCPQ